MPVSFAYNNNAGTLRHTWHQIYTPPLTQVTQTSQRKATSQANQQKPVQSAEKFSFLSLFPFEFLCHFCKWLGSSAHSTESSPFIRERCFITTGQVDIFLCFPCLLSVELTQEDCDLAWWYLRTTPFWYRLGCLKPGLSRILHICCCLLHRAMDSFDGTRGIKGGNQ